MARTQGSNIIQSIEDGSFFVEGETPTGAINGSNKSFTLDFTPAPASSLEVVLNTATKTLTTDYSLSGDTLTLVVAPRTGMTLRVSYHVTPE